MAADNDPWAAAERMIEKIVAESERPFAAGTIAQAKEFLAFLRDGFAVPEVCRGYWPTVCFSWDDPARGPCEVEVFEERLEFYRFFDRRTDIWSFARRLGDPIPSELVAELPLLSGHGSTA